MQLLRDLLSHFVQSVLPALLNSAEGHALLRDVDHLVPVFSLPTKKKILYEICIHEFLFFVIDVSISVFVFPLLFLLTPLGANQTFTKNTYLKSKSKRRSAHRNISSL